ncbi:PREDICTED: uncharacterized protein LOC106891046 [Calidris pugnax]|uniref:uncharacterized protein LOC106891046 n=1 Tax=Calidris pugnax TaxID=198806 RepID=UPI00071D13E1|nr:PREDICTED: uncharacterized protein LOC106891046 [Calidris pugnax]XP_014802723.1 PREDICTED: uncharacterized protein LOC106891046 [Calidris pugnax]
MVCNSSQHCLCRRQFQLHVHGHLVRGHVGDCVTFDLNCVQSGGYVHVIWRKDNQRVAKIKQTENASVTYWNRTRMFPNGSLSRCPTQWGDEGEYVADVYAEDGTYLHQETFNLELNRVETSQEITELTGGSVFLNVTETKLKHFFQVVWKKENAEIARTNGSWFWYHEEYVNRSEIVSHYSLRLDRIQKHDSGNYSIELTDRDGRTVYECIADVKVEEKETFGRNLHVPFYMLIVSLGVVIITALVALIWHFRKRKDKSVWISESSIRHASLILTDEGDNPEGCEERNENSLCTHGSPMQELNGTSITEQRSEDLLRNTEEANPATADKMVYSSVQRVKMEKDPSCQGSNSVKLLASANGMYVAPNTENTTHPESEHCNPSGFEDCLSPGFDHSIPPSV